MLRNQDYYRHQVDRVTRNRNQLLNSSLKDMYLSSLIPGREDRIMFWRGYPETTTRFSKIKPFDCGVSGCVHCHHDKVKKRRFKLSDADIQEMLYEEWGTPVPEEAATIQS